MRAMSSSASVKTTALVTAGGIVGVTTVASALSAIQSAAAMWNFFANCFAYLLCLSLSATNPWNAADCNESSPTYSIAGWVGLIALMGYAGYSVAQDYIKPWVQSFRSLYHLFTPSTGPATRRPEPAGLDPDFESGKEPTSSNTLPVTIDLTKKKLELDTSPAHGITNALPGLRGAFQEPDVPTSNKTPGASKDSACVDLRGSSSDAALTALLDTALNEQEDKQQARPTC